MLDDAAILFKLAGRTYFPPKNKNLFSFLPGDLLVELNRFWVHAEYPTLHLMGRFFYHVYLGAKEPALNCWVLTTCINSSERLGGHTLECNLQHGVWSISERAIKIREHIGKAPGRKRKTGECCNWFWSDSIFPDIELVENTVMIGSPAVPCREIPFEKLPNLRFHKDTGVIISSGKS